MKTIEMPSVSGIASGVDERLPTDEISQTSPLKRHESRLLLQRAQDSSTTFQRRIDRWRSLASATNSAR